MPRIKRKDAQSLANQANTKGGFSVTVVGGTIGRVSDAYMVGGQAPGVSVNAPIAGKDVKRYAASRRELRDPKQAMGAWLDVARPGGPQVDLDVARRFPRTVVGKRAARAETLARNEMAYGELDETGEYAGTHNNPFSSRVMERTPENKDTYLTKQAARNRGLHFRAGITPEAMSRLMSGDRPGAMEAWVRE